MHFASSLNRLSRLFLLLVCSAALGLAAGCDSCSGTVTVQDVGGTNPDPDTGPDDPDSSEESDTGGECHDYDDDGAKGGDCAEATDCNDQAADVYPGAKELCTDARDNDCDGMTNEMCPCEKGELRLCSSYSDEPTRMGPEIYCKPGVQRCEDGKWAKECEGELGPGDNSESCNHVDDDCDGEVDEGLRNAAGQCKDKHPDDPEERCGMVGEGNGLDDDGDGMVDEDCSCQVPDYDKALPRKGQPCYTGPIQTLGVGQCHGGTMNCKSDGNWGACTGQVTPTEETCGDQLDNDCDGVIDEGCPDCSETADEVCNGKDDDCDGIIDEDVRNACGGCGQAASTEKCGDGFDNNCNGSVEEGCQCSAARLDCYPGPRETAGVGICEKGVMRCEGETFGACTGYTLPQLEACGSDGTGNGKDEDCDGQTDEGCGCTDGATRPCGSGVGICERGTQTCTKGSWGDCKGGKGPESKEACNDKDDDCDGLVDERLLNACGTCGDSCYTRDPDPQNDGKTDDGATKIGKGDKDNPTNKPGITLTEKTKFPPYLWIANHDHDTVSKFHSGKSKEVGRYWVGDNPSRTAVDLDGNMWVIGRNDGRLTKILSDTSNCPDRNNNGKVDTSGPGNLGPINSASNPMADECVVYSKVLNPHFRSGRGVTVDATGKVWVAYSTRNPAGIQGIDPQTFQKTKVYTTTNIPIYKPDSNGVMQPTGKKGSTGRLYGIVGDSKGRLYANEWAGRPVMVRFDTNKRKFDMLMTGFQCGTYGIALDGKNRVFAGCSDGRGPAVGMYDPASNKWTDFYPPGKLGNRLPKPKETGPAPTSCPAGCPSFLKSYLRTTAVAVEPATGDVWATFYRIGYVGRLAINENNLANSQWTFIAAMRDQNNNLLPGVPNNLSMRGIGFDRTGFAWLLGPSTNDIWKMDPAKNERVGRFKVGQGGHYTYSDFTGSTALSFTAPKGVWRWYFDTKFPNAQPDEIIVEGYVPKETSLKVRIRTVDTNKNPISAWLPPEQGGNAQYFDYPQGQSQHTIDLATVMGGGLITGPVFEVEVRMRTSNSKKRPILHDVKLKWQRP